MIKTMTITLSHDGEDGTIETPVKLTNDEFKVLKKIGERYLLGGEEPSDVKEPEETDDMPEPIRQAIEKLGIDFDVADKGYREKCNMYRAIVKVFMKKFREGDLDIKQMAKTIVIMVSLFDSEFAETLEEED